MQCGGSRHHWFRYWFIAFSASSHYRNQCLYIVNWTLDNELQWNINGNSSTFIQENTFENVFGEMAAILSWPQYVKASHFMGHSTVFPKACRCYQKRTIIRIVGPLYWVFTGTRIASGFPAHKARKVESVSMPWRLHKPITLVVRDFSLLNSSVRWYISNSRNKRALEK